ncbi:quinolinate synthase NadA [Candidatus Woesearchaeota archaeon]|nr:quinolinate synthase NadA [Candidatus Woesearchaeota archaeon]
MKFTPDQFEKETDRLYDELQKAGWSREDCLLITPLTLEINALKKKQDAIILAHSYQTPDIMYGVADFIGDSYGLARKAMEMDCKKIIFCSVHFMGETAKLLNPAKEVLVPSVAGCSLAASITPEDVRKLRERHPDAGVVCYVNTTAAVKAESDASCTSANVVQIIDAMPQDEIIFIPDKLMGINMKKLTKKKIHLWEGTCIVHERFDEEAVKAIREQYPNAKILAHTECNSAIVDSVDMAGSTSQMVKYIAESSDKEFMLVTECGLTDRIKVEQPTKKIVGTCNLCPYMKEISLKNVLKALKNPSDDQKIEISEDIAEKAKKSLDRMFELEKSSSL